MAAQLCDHNYNYNYNHNLYAYEVQCLSSYIFDYDNTYKLTCTPPNVMQGNDAKKVSDAMQCESVNEIS